MGDKKEEINLASEDLLTRKELEKEVGVKYDQEKLRWDLVPWEQFKEVVKVLMHGANKYPSKDNWKYVSNRHRRYFSAAVRHIIDWYDGEVDDPESGVHHLAHAMCCLLFLMWDDEQEGEK